MGRGIWLAVAAAALACSASLGCGGDDEARRPAGPDIAPPGQGEAAPKPSGGNSPPRIDSVVFSPSSPGVGQSVQAVVEAADPDGDQFRLGYVWSVDGQAIEAKGAKVEISRQVQRGAQLEVRVTASDAHGESEPFIATVAIGNRPPRVASLTIQPAGRITAAGPIQAVATADDPDGDAVSFEYTWTLNGSPSDVRDSVFPDTELKRGDIVELSVIARDDQGESEPLASPRIEVMNAAPVITSQPDAAGSDGIFAYRMTAQDADGDALHYGLGKVPEGMTVVSASGEVHWTPREDQAGVHPVEIWVEDPQGARATQRFELTIGGSAAAAPTAPPEAPPASPSEE